MTLIFEGNPSLNRPKYGFCLISIRWLGLLAVTVFLFTGRSSATEWAYVTNENGTLTITGYSSYKHSELVVPAELEGRTVTGIGAEAFAKSHQDSVTVPASVVRIEERAFAGSGLNRIYIDTGNPIYSSINGGLGSKDGKVLLAVVYRLGGEWIVPEGVTRIAPGAFQNSGVRRIRLPASLEEIGENAFLECDALESIEVADGNARFRSVQGVLFDQAERLLLRHPALHTRSQVEIPEGVVEVAAGAFARATWSQSRTNSMTNIIFPASLKFIGERAFYRNEFLNSLSLPEGLTNISDRAFSGCSSLKSIELPEGLLKVGKGAFRECAEGSEVRISKSVLEIGAEAFPVRAKFSVHPESKSFVSEENVLFSKDRSVLLQVGGYYPAYSVPSSVRHVEPGAFRAVAWEKLSIPATVNSAQDETIAIATARFEVEEGNELWSSNDGVLFSKNGATLIKYPVHKGIGSYEVPVGTKWIRPAAMYYGPIETVILPAGLEEIGSEAFSYSTIKEINFPNSLKRIGRRAFLFTRLREVDLSNAMPAIEQSAFEGCHQLEVAELGGVGSLGEAVFQSCSRLKRVILREGIESIPGGAFGLTPALVEVILPESVTTIEAGAFYGSGIERLALPPGLSFIGAFAFSYCSNLSEMTIPAGVTNIPHAGFLNCSNLVSIGLPPGVKLIPEFAFAGCYLLKVLTLPASLERVEQFAFSGTALETLKVPAGVKFIGRGAFIRNRLLRSVELPNGLIELGGEAFSECVRLSEIRLPESLEHLGTTAFSDCGALETIHLGSKLSALGSGTFARSPRLRNVGPLDNIRSIGDSAFEGTGITNLFAGRSLTNIGERAFANCSGLKAIVVPGSVQDIGNEAFNDCLNLRNVVIEQGVVRLGDGIFGVCSNLTSVDLPAGLIEIGSAAFRNCVGLTNVLIPRDVERMGMAVFGGCKNLERIDVDEGNSVFASLDGALCNKDRTSLLEFPGGKGPDFRIPNGIQTIGSYAFSTVLKSVTIPDSVTRIDHYAFDALVDEMVVGSGVAYLGLRSLSAKTVYFMGDAPPQQFAFSRTVPSPKLYYLASAKGWGTSYGTVRTTPWEVKIVRLPEEQERADGRFRFSVSSLAPVTMVIEAASSGFRSEWVPVSTNQFGPERVVYEDVEAANFNSRIYRLRSP